MGVERVRRAHLNDMENILPFFCLGILYIFTNPALSTAVLVFRIFAACRIVHSVVYLLVIPQPARALAFFGGMGCNLFMGYKIVTPIKIFSCTQCSRDMYIITTITSETHQKPPF